MLGPGDTLNHGAYRIERELGAGGFGLVYLAEEVTLRRKVAIKTILPDVLSRQPQVAEAFYAEARLTAELAHPYILPIYFVGEEAGADRRIPYIVMEYVDGGDLETVLRKRTVNLRQRLRWMHQVAEGLAYAHEQGVIHRDLKPRNVFVARNQTVKIGDFGLAKALGSETQTVLKGLGTPAYISPEQIQGRHADARSDLYSLGIMYYQMLAGRVPYDAPDVSDIAAKVMAIGYQHVHAPIPSVRTLNPEVPPAVDQMIQHLMAKAPQDRPTSATEVAQAMESLVASGRRAPIPDTDPSMDSTQPVVAPIPPPLPRTQATDVSTQPVTARPQAVASQVKRFNLKWGAIPVLLLALGAGALIAKPYLEDALRKRDEAARQAQVKAEEEQRRAKAKEEAARKGAEEAQRKAAAEQRRTEEVRQAQAREEERRPAEAKRAEEERQARLREEERRRQAEAKKTEEERQLRIRRETIARIEDALRRAGMTGLTVAVSPDRVVTLTGTVQDQRQRDEAIRLARLEPGIREVRPNITVAARLPDPDEIRRLVEKRLRESGLTLTVEVNRDRIVTLSGVVESSQMKEEAKRIASAISGVTQVKDGIFVAPPSGGPKKIR
jgi:serine/threonine protein kinase/osmotically-inducible protein OsmY